MPAAPALNPYDSENQSLKNWLHELEDHDVTDTRGILEGLAAVIAILASRIPEPVPEK